MVEVLLDTAKQMFSEEYYRYEKFVGQADNKNGDTALHLAVWRNHLAVVKLILQVNGPHKAKINRDYKTPLFIAAQNGFKDIVRLLCDTFIFENILGPRGQTVLHAAIIGRDPGMYKCSQPKVVLNNFARSRSVVLDVCVQSNNESIFKLQRNCDTM